MSLTTVLVVGVVLVAVIARRVYGEPLRARRLLLAPLIELAIGGYELVNNGGLSAGEWVSLVVTGVLSLALGAGRGMTVQLFSRRGYLWQRYRPITFLVWVGAFVARFGVRALLAAIGVTSTAALSVQSMAAGHRPELTGAMIGTMLITSGLGFAGESLVLTPRARATGIPLQPGNGGGGLLGDLLGGTAGGGERRTPGRWADSLRADDDPYSGRGRRRR